MLLMEISVGKDRTVSYVVIIAERCTKKKVGGLTLMKIEG